MKTMRQMQRQIQKMDGRIERASADVKPLLRSARRVRRRLQILMLQRESLASEDVRAFKRQVKKITGIDLTREWRRLLQSCGLGRAA